MSLHTWHLQGPHKPSSCATFTLNSHWSRATTDQKSLPSMCAGSLWSCRDSPWPCKLWLARLLCQGCEFSRQEYWSVLANIGCHTLLEHYISSCPSHQLCWVPGAARTPETQAPAPLPHLAHTGADSSPSGQPQEQSPVDDPHAEVEIKPKLKSRGSVAKEKDQKPSHQLYKLQIQFTWSTRQPLCLWNI